MSDQPKIVILDAHAANPGDLDWSPIERLGTCTVHPRTPRDEVVDRCNAAEIVLSNKVPLDADTLARLPALRYVGVLATGFNIVDLDAARRANVTVTNIPAYGTESTAQHAFALLLDLTNHVGHLAADSARRWPRSADFCYFDDSLVELDGLTCGVIGFGAIGKAFCRRARAFGMTVLAHTAHPNKHRDSAADLRVELVGLDDVLRHSDVLSLHCPLTPETKGLIGAGAIAKMKPSVLLINTGRGPLLDEGAVADALNAGRLAAAAVDVLSAEPPASDNPLLSAKNCRITPHVAWATTAARRRLIDIAAGNIKAFLNGKPQNVVS